MTLQGFLQDHRSPILERWRELILGSYSEDAARFFRAERDPFQNPVGHSIERATAALYDGICLDKDQEQLAEGLEAMVRLRAVQEFAPSQAVGFAFVLKLAVREALGKANATEQHGAKLVELERRIDAVAASAFDLYVQCREQLFEIRHNELKRRIAVLLRRFGDIEPENSPMSELQEDGFSKGGCKA